MVTEQNDVTSIKIRDLRRTPTEKPPLEGLTQKSGGGSLIIILTLDVVVLLLVSFMNGTNKNRKTSDHNTFYTGSGK